MNLGLNMILLRIAGSNEERKLFEPFRDIASSPKVMRALWRGQCPMCIYVGKSERSSRFLFQKTIW